MIKAGSEPEPEWPVHFPPDYPPVDTLELDHEIFYLVANHPPRQQDFLSAMERYVYLRHPPCERAALSCGIDRCYIEELRNAVPRLRSMLIAHATLEPEHGRIKQTGRPGHHSMWLRHTALADAPRLFEVVP